MKKVTTIFLLLGLIQSYLFAQVKSSYLYNTAMPYGTLDIRTYISSTNYYYLQEGKTFAYRESSPGVRTYRYRDMTSWESNPYLQGNMRWKNGSSDKFIINYRLLKPVNYSSTYSPGYPMIVLVHGGYERGNCFYSTCYHADWNYDPNVNSPMAPTTGDHRLLNNDFQLSIGGLQHLDARNLAGSRLPNDPSMPARAFPGFVLVCQMLNVWDAQMIQQMIKTVLLHTQKYKIDQNRIYIHGLSIGGYGVYEAIKRAPWLFAAALPMSATMDANIIKEGRQSTLAHIPFWMFQGGQDTNPTPTYTKNIINQLRNAGAIVRYTEYPTLGHAVWNAAYAEPDFFTWMLARNNSNLAVYKGNKVINKSTGVYPRLLLPAGFHAYEWQKNGVTFSNTSNTYTVTTPGTYRARFSRLPAPTSTQWNRWSNNVVITETTTASFDDALVVEDIQAEDNSIEVFPNPATTDDLNVQYNSDVPLKITLIDQFGRQVYEESFNPADQGSKRLELRRTLTDGLYFVIIDDGERKFTKRVFIKN